jgi:alcohol dehydrogenase (cytochrome c)
MMNNARNGKLLWKATMGGRVTSGPMTYMIKGRQYVAVCAGNALFVYALRQ